MTSLLPNSMQRCFTAGCNRPVHANGLCNTCYKRRSRQQAKESPVPAASFEEIPPVLGIDDSRFPSRLARIALETLAKENPIDLKSWIEEKITLPPGNGYNRSPKMNFDMFPHMKQILKLVDNPDCKKIVLCFAAQTGKSDTIASIAAYLTGYRNRRGLFVLPTKHLQEKVRDTRLLPLFQNSDVGFKYLQDKIIFNFQSNFFSLALASSTGTMAEQTSTSWVIIDEHDEFNLTAAKSEDPVKLSERRMQASRRKLLIIACTPKETRAGYIFDHYKRSKKFVEEIQCPLCDNWFVPDFKKHFKWPDETGLDDLNEIENKHLAWLECPLCSGKITDAMHLEIVTQRKRWKDLNPRLSIAECGFRLPSFLTPYKNFSMVACEYLHVRNNPQQLADFNNSVLAQPVEPSDSRTSADIDYSKLKGDYYTAQREIPEEVFALSGGVDVGKDEIWLVLLGWASRNRKFVVRSERIERGRGAESLAVAMDKATEMCTMEYIYKGSIRPLFYGGLIDSGYDTDFVYDYCKRNPLWTPAKGFINQRQPYIVTTVDSDKKISKYKDLPFVLLNTDMLNSSLHEYLNTPAGERHSITFPADAYHLLFEHLAAQEQHEVPSKYGSRHLWGKLKSRPDHLRDCLLGAIGFGMIRGYNNIERVE